MKLLFINRSPPYGTTQAKESLDAVLAAATFEQDVSVLFMGDGILQLLNEQNGQLIAQKNLSSMLSVLEMYDVDKIYVQAQAITERGLSQHDFCLKTKVLSNAEITALIKEQDSLLSF